LQKGTFTKDFIAEAQLLLITQKSKNSQYRLLFALHWVVFFTEYTVELL